MLKQYDVWGRKSCSSIIIKVFRVSTYQPAGYKFLGKVNAENLDKALDLAWDIAKKAFTAG